MSHSFLGHQFSESNQPPEVARWGSQVGYVPTSQVARLAFQPLWRNPEEMQELSDSMRIEGIREPLYVMYDPKSRRARLGEGNHRLRAAQMAGITHVPVVVHRWSVPDDSSAPVTESSDFPRQDDYVPGQFHPRYIGLDQEAPAPRKQDPQIDAEIRDIQQLLRPRW